MRHAKQTQQTQQTTPVHDRTAVRGVAWKDLRPMSRREVINELTLIMPWLTASIWCYAAGWLVIGAVCSFFVFLTGLRLSHGCQHYQLPVHRRWQDRVLLVLSAVMLGSMHAVQATHLNHHRHCLGDENFEGQIARQPMWRALLTGPMFPLRLHREALRLATAGKRRWIIAEIVIVLAILISSPWLPTALRWHIGAMVCGECFVGFFAVWTVHHHCDDTLPYRTQRGRWVNRLFYNMFLHTEHHLFPAVPTCHLATLARRIDAATGKYRAAWVIPPMALPTDKTKRKAQA